MAKKNHRPGKDGPRKRGGEAHRSRVARRKERINAGRRGEASSKVPQYDSTW